MFAPDQIVLAAWVNALGWSLVHFIWQGCLIALGYGLLCACARKDSAHLRYGAGLAAYMMAVAAVIFTFKSYYRPAAEFTAVATAIEPANGFMVLSGRFPDLWSALQLGLEPMLPYIVAAWLAGVVLLSFRTATGWWGLSRLRAGATPLTGALMQTAQRMKRTLGLHRAVTFMRSTRVRVPMVVGWWRPVVLLPASVLTGLPRDQLEMVIAHELGHVKRCDYLVNLFQVAVETLLFYHPAIRWIGRRIRRAREHCCDDLVLTRCGRRVVYARALANVELLRSQPSTRARAIPLTGVMTMTGADRMPGDLLARVKRIVLAELPAPASGFARLLVLAAVGFAVAVSARPGMDVQRALRDVAGLAQLQGSDIESRVRMLSRRVWASGVGVAPMEEFFLPATQAADMSVRIAAEGSRLRRTQVSMEMLPQPPLPTGLGMDALHGDGKITVGPENDLAVLVRTPAVTSLADVAFRLPQLDFQSDGFTSTPKKRYCGATGRRSCGLLPRNKVVLYVNPPQARSPLVQNWPRGIE